jgi:putative heme iron utilization protein
MKTATPDPALDKAQAEYTSLLASFQSVQLGTVGKDGIPEASYSPAVNEGKKFYICVSDMSAHTANMLESGKASLMIIADESASSQIFARKRATFACAVSEIARGGDRWNVLIDLFSRKFGNVVDHIRQMGDFHMLELAPSKGRVVLGFGRAFDVSGENLDVLEHVKGIDGEGHRPAPAPSANGHAHDHGHAPASAAAGLSAADVERIVSHMNEDHLDSVLFYVRHFAKRNDAASARLKSIDAQGMDITLDSGEEINIPFRTPLQSAHDAHMTLVSMSKEARASLADA